MRRQQRGNTIVGIIIGVVLGLAAALAVAVYVTKVPVPFMNKSQSRSPEQDAAESRRNKDWDPNAPLYGRNPGKPAPAASGAVTTAPPMATIPAPTPATQPAPAAPTPPAATAVAPDKAPPAVVGKSADPLGELARARAAAASGDPFFYFVQAGAFRTPEDAEAQRAKLQLLGVDARVSEREQSGRQVFRVRVGPFDRKEEADRQKERLESNGVETALVRVQR